MYDIRERKKLVEFYKNNNLGKLNETISTVKEQIYGTRDINKAIEKFSPDGVVSSIESYSVKRMSFFGAPEFSLAAQKELTTPQLTPDKYLQYLNNKKEEKISEIYNNPEFVKTIKYMKAYNKYSVEDNEETKENKRILDFVNEEPNLKAITPKSALEEIYLSIDAVSELSKSGMKINASTLKNDLVSKVNNLLDAGATDRQMHEVSDRLLKTIEQIDDASANNVLKAVSDNCLDIAKKIKDNSEELSL